MNPYKHRRHPGWSRRPVDFTINFPTIETVVAVQNVQSFNFGGGTSVAEAVQTISL
ncbi:MAG TPA: hypothetical protein VIB48_07300 [Acidimicrobiia bacterium]|jgi:hypothetical protein